MSRILDAVYSVPDQIVRYRFQGGQKRYHGVLRFQKRLRILKRGWKRKQDAINYRERVQERISG